jgi:hypothetical protein
MLTRCLSRAGQPADPWWRRARSSGAGHWTPPTYLDRTSTTREMRRAPTLASRHLRGTWWRCWCDRLECAGSCISSPSSNGCARLSQVHRMFKSTREGAHQHQNHETFGNPANEDGDRAVHKVNVCGVRKGVRAVRAPLTPLWANECFSCVISPASPSSMRGRFVLNNVTPLCDPAVRPAGQLAAVHACGTKRCTGRPLTAARALRAQQAPAKRGVHVPRLPSRALCGHTT